MLTVCVSVCGGALSSRGSKLYAKNSVGIQEGKPVLNGSLSRYVPGVAQKKTKNN